VGAVSLSIVVLSAVPQLFGADAFAWVGWIAVGSAVAFVACWLVLRRRPHLTWAAWGLGIAVAGLIVGTPTGGAALPVLLVALTTLVLHVGRLQALVVAVAVVVATYVWSLLVFGYDPVRPLADSVGLLLVGLVGVGLGTLLADLERAKRSASELSAQLAASNAGLQDANARLQEAIDVQGELILAEERARAARELHDGLGHRLTVVTMSLDYAQRMRDREPDRAWAEVARAATTTREALDHMRLWVRALDPPVATDGQRTSFEQVAQAFRGTGLDVRVVETGPEAPMPTAVALFATRLVQEGLTNALRHGDARSVVLEIGRRAGGVRVSVTDDGAAGGTPVEGFGLRSLRERAEALGGALTAGPVADGGFELAADLPWERGD
jgi:signal transduction histidine kinase